MIESFACALTDVIQDNGNSSANMVIAVSEEAETYLPEMEWICEQLREIWAFQLKYALRKNFRFRKMTVLFKNKKVDLIYRFWELFDYENVSIMQDLTRVVEKCGVVVTPPMKHVQEENYLLHFFIIIA